MVSVVITAYNVEKYIKKCIESVLNSTYDNIEVIVVEDRPMDGTSKIIDSIKSDKLIVIKNNENQGAGMSRRIGIQHSTGEYVITVDGDDYISPTFIESLVKKAKETDADVVSGGITIMRNEGAYEKISYGDRIVTGPKKITDFFGEKVVFLNNKIVRRSLYSIVQYSDRRFIEDTQTIAPILYLAKSTAYVDDCGYYYVMRQDSLTHHNLPIRTAVCRALCAKDLYLWFKDKEKPYSDMFGIKLFIDYANKVIQTGNFEEMKRFSNEWQEFTMFYFQILKNVAQR